MATRLAAGDRVAPCSPGQLVGGYRLGRQDDLDVQGTILNVSSPRDGRTVTVRWDRGVYACLSDGRLSTAHGDLHNRAWWAESNQLRLIHTAAGFAYISEGF